MPVQEFKDEPEGFDSSGKPLGKNKMILEMLDAKAKKQSLKP